VVLGLAAFCVAVVIEGLNRNFVSFNRQGSYNVCICRGGRGEHTLLWSYSLSITIFGEPIYHFELAYTRPIWAKLFGYFWYNSGSLFGPYTVENAIPWYTIMFVIGVFADSPRDSDVFNASPFSPGPIRNPDSLRSEGRLLTAKDMVVSCDRRTWI